MRSALPILAAFALGACAAFLALYAPAPSPAPVTVAVGIECESGPLEVWSGDHAPDAARRCHSVELHEIG